MDSLRANIVIAGKAGSGKDTLGDWLIERFGYQRVSLATPIKNIARELWPHLDWSVKQRVVLQRLGSACRDVDPLTWIRLAWLGVEALNVNGISAVITDCRYPNEFEFFHVRGCTVVRVEASYVNRVTRLRLRDGTVDEAALQHFSETALDDTTLPTVNNDDTIKQFYHLTEEFFRNVDN